MNMCIKRQGPLNIHVYVYTRIRRHKHDTAHIHRHFQTSMHVLKLMCRCSDSNALQTNHVVRKFRAWLTSAGVPPAGRPRGSKTRPCHVRPRAPAAETAPGARLVRWSVGGPVGAGARSGHQGSGAGRARSAAHTCAPQRPNAARATPWSAVSCTVKPILRKKVRAPSFVACTLALRRRPPSFRAQTTRSSKRNLPKPNFR